MYYMQQQQQDPKIKWAEIIRHIVTAVLSSLLTYLNS